VPEVNLELEDWFGLISLTAPDIYFIPSTAFPSVIGAIAAYPDTGLQIAICTIEINDAKDRHKLPAGYEFAKPPVH
jgi:hypothetical protein